MARAGGPLGVRRALAGGMLHAGLGQNVLNCNVCKTLFENGDEGHSHGPERLGISIPGPSWHAGIMSACHDGAVFKIPVENKILLLHSSRILARSEH